MINDLEKYASKMTKKFSKENNNITPHKIEKILEEKFNNTSHEKARELVQIWSKDLKKNIDIAYMLSRISEREKKFMFNYLGFDKINRRDLNKEFGHGAMKQADLLTKNYLLVYRRKLFHNVSLNLYENFRIKTFREEKIKISKHDYIYYLLSDLEKIEDMIRNEVIYAKTEQEDTKAQVKYIKYLIITGSLMIVFNIDTAKIWWLNTFVTKITNKLLLIYNVTNYYYE